MGLQASQLGHWASWGVGRLVHTPLQIGVGDGEGFRLGELVVPDGIGSVALLLTVLRLVPEMFLDVDEAVFERIEFMGMRHCRIANFLDGAFPCLLVDEE